LLAVEQFDKIPEEYDYQGVALTQTETGCPFKAPYNPAVVAPTFFAPVGTLYEPVLFLQV